MASYAGNDGLLVGYKRPPQPMMDIVDQPREPLYSFSPLRDMVLEMRRPPAHPTILEYSRPELKLAGVRIDPSGFCRSKQSHYTSLSLGKRTTEDLKLPFPEGAEHVQTVEGIPEGHGIRDVSWSTDGMQIAFTVRKLPDRPDESPPPAELWVASVADCTARKLVGDLNSVFVSYSWLGNDSLIVSTVPKSVRNGRSPLDAPKSFGPRVESFTSQDGVKSQSRTYQDLLKNAHDEALFEHYCRSTLVKVDVASGSVTQLDDKCSGGDDRAAQDGRVYTACSTSPSGEYVMVAWLQKPWSYSLPCGRFPKVVELWDKDGNFIKRLADLPLAANIPLAFDSCREGPRSVGWRDDKPHEMTWVECQDGGDPAVDVSPRDVLFGLDASEAGDPSAAPTVLGQTDMRYSGVLWCDDSLALMYESEWKTRTSKTWIIAPDGSVEKKLLFDLNYEDSYNDPGSPVLRRDENGSYILAEVDKKRQILLSGAGASPEGSKPFLDLLDLDSGEKRRLWRSSPPQFESMSTILSDTVPGVIKLEDLEMLARRETEDTPAQFSIATFTKDGELDKDVQISDFDHPYPGLVGMKKEILQYERKDGVKLNGTLYTPPGFDKTSGVKLPCVAESAGDYRSISPSLTGLVTHSFTHSLISLLCLFVQPRCILWAYPREFKTKDSAGQLRKSPHQFVTIGSTSPLMLLTEGYAVFDGPRCV